MRLVLAILLLLCATAEARPVRRCAPILRHANPSTSKPPLVRPQQVVAQDAPCCPEPKERCDLREPALNPFWHPCEKCTDGCACDPCDCCRCEVCRCADEAKSLAEEANRRALVFESQLVQANSERDEALSRATMFGNTLMWLGLCVAIGAWLICVAYRPKRPRVGDWCLLIAMLGLCNVAQAGVPRERQEAVARVYVYDPGGRNCGSGTLVAKNAKSGWVLTCAHIFREFNPNPGGRVEVLFPNGEAFNGITVGIDHSADLAVVNIAAPKRIDPVPFAPAPEIGDMLTSAGYGGNNIIGFSSGKMTRHVSISELHGQFIEMTGAARSGDSGGPIFNDRGELAGVEFCSDERFINGAGSDRALTFFQQSCADGRCYRVAPMPQPMTPVPPPPAPRPVTPQAIKGDPGPAGKDGAPGPQGPKGDDGKDGKDATVDMQALVAAVLVEIEKRQQPTPSTEDIVSAVVDKLPGIKFEIYDQGKLIPNGSRTVRLGGTVPLERYLIQQRTTGPASPAK